MLEECKSIVIAEKMTIVLSNFEGLEDYLQGKKDVYDLNERVFLNGFVPVRYQKQISKKFGEIYVIQGIVDDEFLKIERNRIDNQCYDIGWTLFLDGPYEYAKVIVGFES